MFYIYTIQNKVNNKLYVGWTHNYDIRWKKEISSAFCATDKAKKSYDYNSLLSKAFRKYAKTADKIKDFFLFQVIEEFEECEKNESHNAEMHYIEFFRTNVNRFGRNAGYNLTDGGEFGWLGAKHSEETKKKLSENRMGKDYLTKEWRENFGKEHCGENNSSAKLTWEIVKNIRNDYFDLGLSYSELRKKYNIIKRKIVKKYKW